MFSKKQTTISIKSCLSQIEKLRQAIDEADAVIVGAGAGLSESSGLSYDGQRFNESFSEFIKKYHFADMYSATFYPYDSLEEYWAYMSRHIDMNRYSVSVGKPCWRLLEIIKDKDYFVITTNVDHQFQKAGIDKHRLFYTQGDYGLWQCSVPCHDKTYDNEKAVIEMLKEQQDLRIPSKLVPCCPKCGEPMSMNLRCDDTFVQDDGWHMAASRYGEFVRRHSNLKTLYLELGIGNNTPAIIKYPFWKMTAANANAAYACINLNDPACPREIEKQSICIGADIGQVMELLI